MGAGRSRVGAPGRRPDAIQGKADGIALESASSEVAAEPEPRLLRFRRTTGVGEGTEHGGSLTAEPRLGGREGQIGLRDVFLGQDAPDGALCRVAVHAPGA